MIRRAVHKLKTVGTFLILTLIAAQNLRSEEPVALRGISVATRRPADTGREETRIDSAGLRESVAQSMADVLGFNSAVFVKNYGRATLSTVTFRGTSPSHTQVTWNGMRISSPMLGSTDFSMIPSFFVDDARLVHGSSSLTDVGGGIGGLVKLASTSRGLPDGLSATYVQGAGSWRTFDEFLRVGLSRGPWEVSARVAYSSSRNDFKYINHDKRENIYDDNNQIIGWYHPEERNRPGAYKDFHALASASYDAGRAGRWSLDAWYMSSNREIPMISTDYGDSRSLENRQREQTLRAVASWEKGGTRWRATARAGYVHSWMAYDYRRGQAGGQGESVMTRSRSRVNTFYGAGSFAWYPSAVLHVTAGADVHAHSVSSYDYAAMTAVAPGYDRSRGEASLSAGVRWRPVKRAGAGITVRQEFYGSSTAAPVPAVFADYVLVPAIGLTAKLSGSRNYRFPTLNDLYTVPGGNSELRPEKGWTYDAALSAGASRDGLWHLEASAGWFDSYIDDWILWLPSPRGFYVPRNVREVRACGVETSATARVTPARGWDVSLSVNYTWSSSINRGEAMGDGDRSVGKQLPYVPRHSASAVARAGWRGWWLAYAWQWYSERFTMSSNEDSITGKLPPYSVSNLSLEKRWRMWNLDFSGKLTVNNLLDADYRTVLSRPMPGRNFEIFLSVGF